MDACLSVEKEVDKVVSKFSHYSRTAAKSLDETIAMIQKLEDEIRAGGDGNATMSDEQKELMRQGTSQVSESSLKVATDHRELHSTVSKVGKAIDRGFVSDFHSTSRDDFLTGPDNERVMTGVIIQHLNRQGLLEISNTLANESGIHDYKTQGEPFRELNAIVTALREKNLEPALNWATRHRNLISNLNSAAYCRGSPYGKASLELRLHKLKFIHLLSNSHRMEAIRYARQNFPRFVSAEEKEVQSLMGAVMYGGQALATSPYAHLLDPCHWSETEDQFIRESCSLMGLPIGSPLTVAVHAGSVAVPALLNIKQVMLQRQVAGVWNDKELPIEIDLPSHYRFHSVFACPILRQQVSDANPPMRLTCGHVISRDALAKLAAGLKLKCPYCPVEQNPTDARQITF